MAGAAHLRARDLRAHLRRDPGAATIGLVGSRPARPCSGTGRIADPAAHRKLPVNVLGGFFTIEVPVGDVMAHAAVDAVARSAPLSRVRRILVAPGVHHLRGEQLAVVVGGAPLRRLRQERRAGIALRALPGLVDVVLPRAGAAVAVEARVVDAVAECSPAPAARRRCCAPARAASGTPDRAPRAPSARRSLGPRRQIDLLISHALHHVRRGELPGAAGLVAALALIEVRYWLAAGLAPGTPSLETA